jgi:2-desacetyl-2-hydroxyethyl bacteriochlorophyllide A dehydrogenase
METTVVVFEKPNEVSLRTVPLPPPAAGEVQLRTLFSTISAGTEGWALGNQFTWSPTKYPCVPGYQRVGVVTQIGEGVEGWREGDVALVTIGRWSSEVSSMWGAHAAMANSPATELYRLPDGVDPLDASGAVVAQVGYNAASRAHLQPGDWVAVYGDGLIGQCAAVAARARGARVVLVGHRSERLALAMTTGVEAIVNSHDGNVTDVVRERAGIASVAVVLDSVQTELSQREYVELLERGRGQIVYCGFTPGTVWADMGLLQQRELTTHFVSGWNRARMEATLKLMAEGKMRLRPLITHRVSYTRAPEMYRLIREKSEPFLGITLDWTKHP